MNYYLNALRNYANFSGRARRAEYWFFALFQILNLIILVFIDYSLGLPGILTMLYNFATIIPGIAVAVRRMHDVGKSGFFIFIPIYSFILVLTEGDIGDNRYGPDPKGNQIQGFDDLLGD